MRLLAQLVGVVLLVGFVGRLAAFRRCTGSSTEDRRAARTAAAVRQSPPRSLGNGCSLKSWTPSLQGRVPCARIARQPSGTAHEVDQSARECQHGDAVVGGDADHFGECRRGIGAAQGHHDSFSEVEWAAPLIDACQPVASRLFEHGRLTSVSKDYLATARVRLRRGAESSSHG